MALGNCLKSKRGHVEIVSTFFFVVVVVKNPLECVPGRIK